MSTRRERESPRTGQKTWLSYRRKNVREFTHSDFFSRAKGFGALKSAPKFHCRSVFRLPQQGTVRKNARNFKSIIENTQARPFRYYCTNGHLTLNAVFIPQPLGAA